MPSWDARLFSLETAAEDGARGVNFILAAVDSAKQGAKWVKVALAW